MSDENSLKVSPYIHKQDVIGIFARHKVAANLLMAIMILVGFWSLSKLNTQFFPNFEVETLSVNVVWSGASAEDIESSLTSPIEQELRSLDNVKKMTSTSRNGLSSIILEYDEGTDMGVAMDQVKEKIALIRYLPSTAEKPEVTRLLNYELIARILLTGTKDTNELRYLSRKIEDELLERGIAKITTSGLPEEEVAVQVPSSILNKLGVTLEDIGNKVAGLSKDIQAGSIGGDDNERDLRSLEQKKGEGAFSDIPVFADNEGRLIKLGDIAKIDRRAKKGSITVHHNNKPAVELTLYRIGDSDALKSAEILQKWIEEARSELPAGISLKVYDEIWHLIYERIYLLVKNGLGGLLLVVMILYLFLNGRVAWWVTVGIPVTFMATLGVLYVTGGSINMVSLFAMIMALGIIVDDAIVVGEDALTHYQSGDTALASAEGGARRMLAPVLASSLTTIAAFIPLLLVSGIMGKILIAIPLLVICVIIASLVECFLVLPGHLHHSFEGAEMIKDTPRRQKLDALYIKVREEYFRPLVTKALNNRRIVLSSIIALFLVIIGLVMGGRLGFSFFTSPEASVITANVYFVDGTPQKRLANFMEHLEDTLDQTNNEFGGNIIRTAVTTYGRTITHGGIPSEVGNDHLGSILLELTEPDHRDVRNREFIESWEKKIKIPAGLENYIIRERKGGPPGRDIDINLSGEDPRKLKEAALELQSLLTTFKGVNAIGDDMPFGKEQLIYKLTPEAISLGLTVDSVGKQLRNAFDGHLSQIFLDGKDEVEVRVMLPDKERRSLATLEKLMVRLPSGSSIPLMNAVDITSRRGFETLKHYGGQLSIRVSADVDKVVNNSNRILNNLEEGFLKELNTKYGLGYYFEGKASYQEETIADMKRGMVFALLMIYLVLAWVFGSYGWPIMIMITIPFGLIGAVAGHFIMGFDLSILSMFGFFGLSGIVVNDSIVLVIFYKTLRKEGMEIREALIEAACQRLRAVLLTSLTTIGGLLPLLFETSLQAQFLIPMAVSISFGLLFATVLVLLVVPTLLSIYEEFFQRFNQNSPTFVAN
ncbi:MAG: efflux RND transporter permease subunit [Nitrospinae bacterium]|nr:efflux RND transporter permease subunit [Nitrospinota bacterium]